MRNVNKTNRNSKCRLSKKVVLVITSKKGITTNQASEILGINTNEKSVKVLVSELTGKQLERAVRMYMRNNEISIGRGDEVVYFDEVIGTMIDSS